jgi:N-hydroxyarylamine O-acetyltransferase
MKDSGIAKYLSRIKLDNCTANLVGLTKLQEHHTVNIPFENLDIVVGRKILLNYNHLFDKVVLKKRGGYCFELNILYAELLKSLGFSPKPVLGRVWLSNPKKMPPRNHLAYLIKLEGRTYVTDVGFGGLITRMPLDINVSSPVNDKDGIVRLVQFSVHQFMIQRQTEKGWTNQYSFEDLEISEEDIAISNHYMSTHPNSHLFHHKFVGRNTKEGRIGLFNNKMSIRKGIKVVDKKRVNFGTEWLETIKNEFSLNLDFSEKEFNLLFEVKLEM